MKQKLEKHSTLCFEIKEMNFVSLQNL